MGRIGLQHNEVAIAATPSRNATGNKDSSTRKYSPPAVRQAGRILFYLAGSPAPQMSLGDISAYAGVSGSKAFGILKALEESGIVKRGREGKGYALAPGLITLARKVLNDLTPSRLAEPILDRLAKETGGTTVLGLITGDTVFIAAKRESVNEIRVVARIGQVRPLSYGAHGKAIVAFLADDERERLLRGGTLYFYGNPGRLDRTRLRIELGECRRKGFAHDLGEAAPGINVLAAPVIGVGRAPIGFLETFVLAPRDAAVGFGPAVARAAQELSRQLGAQME